MKKHEITQWIKKWDKILNGLIKCEVKDESWEFPEHNEVDESEKLRGIPGASGTGGYGREWKIYNIEYIDRKLNLILEHLGVEYTSKESKKKECNKKSYRDKLVKRK